MSRLEYCKSFSLRMIPYHEIRPHHMLALYGFVQLLSTSGIFQWAAHQLLRVGAGLTDKCIPLVHMGLVPDCIIRYGIRLKLSHHLTLLESQDCESELQRKTTIIDSLRVMPIAIETGTANQQHYEVPAEFYSLCLGPCKKYSCGLWLSPSTNFLESEVDMLDLYCQRAGVEDGMRIVDLGCGWGSLSLYLATQYPNCQVTGISNSQSQHEYIMSQAKERGLSNIRIITCNVADDKGALNEVRDNDIVMTVEMFEHMKNYSTLLGKVYHFLKPSGKLFVHIFTHKNYAYHFEEGWMAENFFTGGTMPSDDLLLYFAQDLVLRNHWRVNGTHYEKTSNGWLKMLDENWKKGKLQSVLQHAYGKGKEREWYVNWRLFFLACAELWGYDGGNEWIVSHYLFERRR